MVRVTMMRGAQSGGVVTYANSSKGEDSLRGIRSRVCNGKRTDLSKLVRAKMEKNERGLSRNEELKRIYAGHTRFATTSIASFDGTHPHQWSKGRTFKVHTSENLQAKETTKFVENYICHNGDLDFFNIGGKTYDLGAVQMWLERTLHVPMPATVDSAAIAGLIDLHRVAGVWALSVRYGFVLGVQRQELLKSYPSMEEYERTAAIFSKCMMESSVYVMDSGRHKLISRMQDELKNVTDNLRLGMQSGSKEITEFVESTVNAFFDNDLLVTVQKFLKGAKGSFGLCVNSSLDADRQICVAARGQTISVAFYPKAGLVLWGSEQAAVKTAIGMVAPGSSTADLGPAVRLDLDDLGGEICLLDWGKGEFVSGPNRSLEKYSMMDGQLNMVLVQEMAGKWGKMQKRLVPMDGNPLVLPVSTPSSTDLVGCDIADIPRIIAKIQNDWRNGEGMNRVTAWNFARKIKERINADIQEPQRRQANGTDLLLTGCEVSLWVAEQFAADFASAFPNLRVRTISANKLLGLHGQDFPVPTAGHQGAEWDLRDAVVLLVSHSGGTFGSLAVSNLLQSFTRNLFAICGEWDTQISKQLRAMNSQGIDSRIFSTDIGVRPAEPCSLSVVATHQMLTQIFQYVSMTVMAEPELRRATKCRLLDSDLKELERLNQDNIAALEDITGTTKEGKAICGQTTSHELRKQGSAWAQHVLEAPRSWIMIVIYVLATVISGYPIVTGVAMACGLESDGWGPYITRTFDALIYIFLPQITVLLIRIYQGRALFHRMVGRAIVIGDIPWVAQSSESFLSKLFAVSYSNTGVTVLSGNPTDHLVHRHTHKVVRGTLLACGRPDGRLSALTSAESSVCLSVNQASSIQSLGVTCESITVGHNPSKLPLSKNAIIIKGNRPNYLCEQLLIEQDGLASIQGANSSSLHGAFANLRGHTKLPYTIQERMMTYSPNTYAIVRRNELKAIFDSLDTNGGGTLDFDEFTQAFKNAGGELPRDEMHKLFDDADIDGTGGINLQEFEAIMKMDMIQILKKLGVAMDPSMSAYFLANVEPSNEKYLGEQLRSEAPQQADPYQLVETQYTSMRLYETRVASMQRFVAFCVMFHELGLEVQDWWSVVSFGFLAYRMDRTHSIMRIATTASPISGAEIRDRMQFEAAKTSWNKMLDTVTKSLRRKQLWKDWAKEFASQDRTTGLITGADLSSPTTPAKQNFPPSQQKTAPSRLQRIVPEHPPPQIPGSIMDPEGDPAPLEPYKAA
eukprot:gnl/MRDRNA2_/MRDRNA2_86072_c0_seq2.p1 gnl/MRDRNA2_/MRDRNA2_86072_c0~~gnl/MRDRNA2_/MRDRNA2_86072_c0_seq2.p1  ORF type:complete len:1384 (+),score=218.41 gnl/MRDRNA2_/MRDRNA2_86072_c0_seq2:410-4153(+)